MSYTRFGPDSDVYVFMSDEGIECCGCPMGGSYTARSTDEMVAHLAAHVERGEAVPDDVVPSLLEDANENEYYLAHGEWPKWGRFKP